MEGLAAELGIGQSSPIYAAALDLFHRLRLRLGSSTKLPQSALQAAALHLAATLLHPHQLDLEVTARKSSTPLRMLTAALETIMATLGAEMLLLTTDRLCGRLGWSAAVPWVQLVETLYASSQASAKTVAGNPVVRTAVVYLALQTAGIRVALGAICAAAHTNPQHVQRCVLEIKAAIAADLERLLSREETLIKEIKAEGRQEVKRKRLERPPSKNKLVFVDLSAPPRKPERPKSLLEIHHQHDLGFAIMLPGEL